MITSYDTFRVSLFLVCIALVYYLALRWCVDRWCNKEIKSTTERIFRSRKTGIALLLIAASGVLCIFYGFVVEPSRLTVTHYEIQTTKLGPDERVRIVQLADLHIREHGPRERALPALVESLEPDLILHTGDFFADEGMEPVVAAVLKSWNVPQYACEGNLDTLGELRLMLQDAGVQLLDGTLATFKKVGSSTPIVIAGFPSGAESYGMKPLLQRLAPDTFNIVLYHHPQGFPVTWDTYTDLMLAGHTHGGQIRLPFYGALVTLDAYGKRWESGFFEEHGARLVVSRGIGCEPHVPEMRFLCPPEVVVIDIVGQASSQSGSS